MTLDNTVGKECRTKADKHTMMKPIISLKNIQFKQMPIVNMLRCSCNQTGKSPLVTNSLSDNAIQILCTCWSHISIPNVDPNAIQMLIGQYYQMLIQMLSKHYPDTMMMRQSCRTMLSQCWSHISIVIASRTVVLWSVENTPSAAELIEISVRGKTHAV